MTPLLIIVRGLPGSGKTTLARMLTHHVFENDDYFRDDEGNYWRPRPENSREDYKLNMAAREQCMAQVTNAMDEQLTPIAVANCHIKRNSVHELQQLAARYGYRVCVVTCNNDFGSATGVPAAVMHKLRMAWEA